jgi:hypothetical protein
MIFSIPNTERIRDPQNIKPSALLGKLHSCENSCIMARDIQKGTQADATSIKCHGVPNSLQIESDVNQSPQTAGDGLEGNASVIAQTSVN